MAKVKVAVIVGSNRRESINRKLAQALAGLAEGQLAFHFISIADLPLYNQDLEGGCRRALPASNRGSPRPMRCCS